MTSAYLPPVRVIIADDCQFFREGFRSMLHKQDLCNIEVVEESENGRQLLDAAERFQPDVVITDIRMPLMDGIESTKFINRKFPNIRVIAISSFEDPYLIYDMFEAGATGYLLKNASISEVVDAITAVRKDKLYYCNSTSRTLIKLLAPIRHKQSKLHDHDLLTDNEICIIRMICKQFTTKEIADKMHISVKSVENYSKNIKEKTDTKNLVGIALFAIKHGLVNIADM